ncbi:hypothetical protein [Streptomyces sp. NPDC002537]
MFELPGPLDVETFRGTLRLWTERHETLRSGFRTTDAGTDRFTVDADAVSVNDAVEEACHDAGGGFRDTAVERMERPAPGPEVLSRVNRTHEGVRLTARYPGTEIATASVTEFADRVRGVLRSVAKTGDYVFRSRSTTGGGTA